MNWGREPAEDVLVQNERATVLYRDVDGQLVPLDQSVHGNDFWQTVYDVLSNTYQMSYNLSPDGMESSKWVLKQTNHAD